MKLSNVGYLLIATGIAVFFLADSLLARDDCSSELAELRLTGEESSEVSSPICDFPPRLDIRWYYDCYECGSLKTSRTANHQAYGACFRTLVGANQCWPTILPPIYSSSNRITMRTRSQAYFFPTGCSYVNYVNQVSISCACPGTGQCDMGSPIVVSLVDPFFETTTLSCGVEFDIDGDSVAEPMAWLRGWRDDAFLALDRDGDGLITSGVELFGDHSPQPPSDEPNGFLALGPFDQIHNGGNGDGQISREDRIFQHLLLWNDRNHDGVSQRGELTRLASSPIAAFSLDYRHSDYVDPQGNHFKYWAPIETSSGAARAWDIFFVLGTSAQAETRLCDAWS